MGLWDRIRGVGRGGYHERAAKKLERSGDLAGAVEAYLEGGLPDEAARVLLLRADAEPALERRMAFFEQASSTALDPTLSRSAKGRRAKLSFDLLKQRGASARSEIVVAAQELEAAQEWLVAAEAYALAGDAEGEIRALTGAGAIERLEERLQRDASASREEAQLSLVLRKVQDLDRGAERRLALRMGAEAGDKDDRLVDLIRQIRQRLVRTRVCELGFGGQSWTIAFGAEVSVGRGEATIVVSSRALSRVHLRLRRDVAGQIVVEDAGTRNGTFLRGARLGGAIPLGEGLALTLGADVACSLAPHATGGALIEVAGAKYLAPLGRLRVDPFELDVEGALDETFLVLESRAEAPAYRGSMELARRIELCFQDEITATRGGEAVLTVGRPREIAS